jgi:hypothetical protein
MSVFQNHGSNLFKGTPYRFKVLRRVYLRSVRIPAVGLAIKDGSHDAESGVVAIRLVLVAEDAVEVLHPMQDTLDSAA